MSEGAAVLAEGRQVLAAAVAFLPRLPELLTHCPNGELAGLLAELGEINAFTVAGAAAAVAEADHRGIIAESQAASVAAWVADSSWHLRRLAWPIAKTARAISRPELADLADSVFTADIDAATAVTVAAEYDTLAADLREDARSVVLRQLLNVGAEHGPAGVRKLKQEILARYGEQGEFEEHERRCRRQIELSVGRQVAAGLWDHRLVLDAESRSVLEAIIGPLSAPQPDPEAGGRDTRSAGHRRGLALVEVLRRSVQAAGHVPTSAKAVLTVTVDFDTLREQVAGAGQVVGTVADGTLLGCATVAKLACDAAILPAVLTPHGQVLALGRARRLFSTDQVRALWLRDRHCTFAGCEVPAAFCDAHHLILWAHGGPTDLGNAALLCGRHHTVVHRDRLAGTVTDQGVEWDRRPGSYQATPPTSSVRGGPPADLPDRPAIVTVRDSWPRPTSRQDPVRPARANPAGATTNPIRRT